MHNFKKGEEKIYLKKKNSRKVYIGICHAEIGQTVHDVVNALSKVIVQILVTGGGDSQEGGAAGGRLVWLVWLEARVTSVKS